MCVRSRVAVGVVLSNMTTSARVGAAEHWRGDCDETAPGTRERASRLIPRKTPHRMLPPV